MEPYSGISTGPQSRLYDIQIRKSCETEVIANPFSSRTLELEKHFCVTRQLYACEKSEHAG
jgi:hypothetical protein